MVRVTESERIAIARRTFGVPLVDDGLIRLGRFGFSALYGVGRILRSRLKRAHFILPSISVIYPILSTNPPSYPGVREEKSGWDASFDVYDSGIAYADVGVGGGIGGNAQFGIGGARWGAGVGLPPLDSSSDIYVLSLPTPLPNPRPPSASTTASFTIPRSRRCVAGFRGAGCGMVTFARRLKKLEKIFQRHQRAVRRVCSYLINGALYLESDLIQEYLRKVKNTEECSRRGAEGRRRGEEEWRKFKNNPRRLKKQCRKLEKMRRRVEESFRDSRFKISN
ncbi:hypothetical protein C8J56DRAFT_897217 [Mycena floridula]|nr:hypothetical protein C8J56DRAFT_897217 [Mycena floridula]